jgi:hypothetical protein
MQLPRLKPNETMIPINWTNGVAKRIGIQYHPEEMILTLWCISLQPAYPANDVAQPAVDTVAPRTSRSSPGRRTI